MKISIATFFLLLIFGYAFSQTNITTIPDTENGYAYVFDKGDLNITVYCEVIVDNILRATSWYLQRQSDEGPPMLVLFDSNGIPHIPSDLYDDIIVLGEEITPGGKNFQKNFTILNFTSQLDQALLQCGTSGVRRNFILGLSVLPSVRDLGTQQVHESNDITVDLTVADSPDPFPPMISTQWMFGDQTLSSDTSITLNDYNITFINVERNMSGNYELTVFNDAGSSTGTFELDVQYEPEAISVDNREIVLTGSTITLIAFITITGNPQPSV